MPDELHQKCARLIEALGLGAATSVTEVAALSGGVASDIARVTVGDRVYCAKFALEKLRVAADWHAPVRRGRAEYEWLRGAGQVAPSGVPRLFGYSDEIGGFAMEYIAGPQVVLWKSELLSGRVRVAAASSVADLLGQVHAVGSAPGFDQSRFHNSKDFNALRIEPYLIYTAAHHPEVAPQLRQLAHALDTCRATLVHGDVSPKNILFRGDQPVMLDAECASMGDPAFDVAFCLNHLMLKAVHLPTARGDLMDAARSFWQAYVGHIVWEDPQALEQRVAALVPALMLARVDGKSPVEYLSPTDRDRVRVIAVALLSVPSRDMTGLLLEFRTRVDAT